MTTNELAKLMGQKESDVQSFVDCLRVWIDKGYTIEAAIEKHMAQMGRFLDHATEIPKGVAVDAFFQ